MVCGRSFVLLLWALQMLEAGLTKENKTKQNITDKTASRGLGSCKDHCHLNQSLLIKAAGL